MKYIQYTYSNYDFHIMKKKKKKKSWQHNTTSFLSE